MLCVLHSSQSSHTVSTMIVALLYILYLSVSFKSMSCSLIATLAIMCEKERAGVILLNIFPDSHEIA